MARKNDGAAVAFLAVLMVLAPFVAAYYVFKLLRWVLRMWRAHKLMNDPAYRAREAMKLRDMRFQAMSPIAFEQHCADVLESQGWLCEVTPPSADFGVDVIANRPGAKVAIQVKKWTAAVNLSAVQEVAAGRAHVGAQHAAVVSVSGYLPSAVELARSNRVMLLAYEDLFDFNRRADAWFR